MKAVERRKAIVARLQSAKEAVSGSTLSEEFQVSRQIIVQDIAMLKAAGHEIFSTHQGYLIQRTALAERVFKVFHTTEETEDELSIIVQLGGMVADVFVWHRVYGKIAAPLNICSMDQVKQFIDGVRNGKSQELMNITGGYHYHTVRAENEGILETITEELAGRGYLVPEHH